MVWLPSLLFVVLLAWVHELDPRMHDQPLSMSRDGPAWVAGYLTFAALLAACVAHVATYRSAHPADQRFIIGPAVAFVLLLVVVLTPTRNALHEIAAFSLLGWAFLFYGCRLLNAQSVWFWVYLAGMFVWLVASLGIPFGVWQKSIIGVYVVLMNLDAWAVKGLFEGSLDRLVTPRRRRGQKVQVYRPRTKWRRYDGRGRQELSSV
jgi:hypothetical protein